MPFHLHLFMGTPFFSETPFKTNPSVLDVDKVGVYGDEGYYNPGSKHTKYLLSESLAEIRKKYYVRRIIICLIEVTYYSMNIKELTEYVSILISRLLSRPRPPFSLMILNVLFLSYKSLEVPNLFSLL